MCLIIVRNPGIEIDPDKLRSACLVNPDGFGVSVIDRGKIETIKQFTGKGNDANELIRIFNEAKDQKVIAHLRFTTKGKANLDNCHPFPLYKEGEYEAMFMHNGTISLFGDEERSDSRHFAEDILGPMTRAFYGVDGASVFENKTYREVIEKYRPGGSIFTLYDSEGNVFSMGKGVEHEGWWSSNDYSFNRNHRSDSDSDYYGGYPGSNWNYNTNNHIPWNEAAEINRTLEKHPAWRMRDSYNSHKNAWGRWNNGGFDVNVTLTNLDKRCKKVEVKPEERGKSLTVVEGGKSTTNSQSTSSTNATTANESKMETSPLEELKKDCAAIGAAIHAAKNANLEPVEHPSPDKRVTFCELADLVNLQEIEMLDEEELYELCERWPLAATMLLMDLIFELWRKKLNDRISSVADAAEEKADAAAFKAVAQ